MPAEKIPAGTLPAAHGQHHGRRFHHLEAPLPADAGDKQAVPLALQIHHGGGKPMGDPQLDGFLNEPGGVLRPGELFLKGVQPEPTVDALVENPAQLRLPLQDQHVPGAALPGGNGRGQACRAPADNHNVMFHS